MAFFEFRFFIFFLIVFATYWLLNRNSLRKVWLLVCSYGFYAAWDWRFLSLIVLSTLVDYAVAQGLQKTESSPRRMWLLAISLLTNLGLLAFFKYFGFFVESAEALTALLGVPFKTETLSIILPVGISFYTFQTLSYTIDVYRRRLEPTRSLLDFALYVCFFPQLIAGPIVRAKSFLPQLDLINRWKWSRAQLGMHYFILGLFKKIAIADRMAYFTDPVFSDPNNFETGTLWLAAVAFTIQLYCDFSGYSDMAIGTASLLGFRLTKNFDMPLAAANISEFWRRWHISLSSWVRDYVYFPLGGSRVGNWRTSRNLIVTLTLVGLWHGAAWTYVVFGLMHGIMLMVHRMFRNECDCRPRLKSFAEGFVGTHLRVAITFCFACLCFVMFRANNVTEGLTMMGHMLTPFEGAGVPTNERGFWLAFVMLIVAHLIGHHKKFFLRIVDSVPTPIRGLGYASFVTLAVVLSPEIDKAFIYFQF